MKIGFVGLGHMGEPMARNPLQAAHSLTVFDYKNR
jgi:3-hydroxyisobutyrate dehydrogenase